MRLLFDENLSPRLVPLLAKEYPGSLHVRECRLVGATDAAIWEYARESGLAVTSKDSDFLERSYLEGAPPKVVHLQVGNAGTLAIAALLRDRHATLAAFAESTESSALVLVIEAV